MWRLAWQLLTFGVALEFTIPLPYSEFQQRVRTKRFLRELRRSDEAPRIAYRQRRLRLVVKRIRFSLWRLGRLVFYADIVNRQSSVQLRGRFLFNKYMRVKWWLGAVLLCCAESVFAWRLVTGFLEGKGSEFVLGAALSLVPIPLFAMFCVIRLHAFAHTCATDLQLIADDLQATFT